MGKNIRDNYSSNENIGVIIGAGHTLESLEGFSVYSQIKDLEPKRIILFEDPRTWEF